MNKRYSVSKKPRVRTALVATLALFGTLLAMGGTGTAAACTITSPDQSPPPQGVDVDADLEALTQDIAPTLGDHWAGGWANPDGTITVALTEGAPVPPALANHPKVQVVTRKHSTDRLHAANETVVARLNALLAPGVEPGTKSPWPYQSGVTNQGNIVEVMVDESRKDECSDIEEALAGELAAGTVRITYGKVPSIGDQIDPCGTRYNCSAPFRGGIEGNNCTLGFVMRTPNGVRCQSTAAHCGSQNWSHGGRAIGPTIWDNNSSNHDFQLIRQDNETEPAPTNWIYRDVGIVAVTLKITTPGANLENINLCTEGKHGAGCGTLVNWDATVDGRCCFGNTSAITCNGDSGAPVVNSATNRAYGFHMGAPGGPNPECRTPTYFTWVPNAEAASGLTVLLTPTSEALGYGQRMPCGYALVSPNGLYNLQMQCSDGNLVLYGPGGALWHTGTYPNPGASLVMQRDGNLVIYRTGNVPIWNRPSGARQSGSFLVLQDDSNLVVYGPTGTPMWHRWCNC